MSEVNLEGFGYLSSATVSASSKTLALSDAGVVQDVTVTSTITLPATSAKANFIVRVGADGITLNISPDASDKIAGYGATNSGAGTDNKDLIFTSQPVGSYVQLQGDGTDGYTVTRLHGTATFES